MSAFSPIFKKYRALLLLFLTTGTIFLAGFYYYLHLFYESPVDLKSPVNVTVAMGASSHDIVHDLYQKKLINNASLFKIKLRQLGVTEQLQAGEYQFSGATSPRDIVDKMTSGDVIQYAITFAEGLSNYQIIEQLKMADNLVGNIQYSVGEGLLYPSTYFYIKGDSRDSILRRMHEKVRSELEGIKKKMPLDLPVDLTMDEVITLASIVEKESALISERAKIAGVFFNRLRKNMRLQSDPTVIYAVSDKKGILPRPLYKKDLKIKHPFNTYYIKGLPPHPICNPSLASIMAVLSPEATDALYFVADGKGGHVFANNLKDHNKNVANWRRMGRDK